MIFKCIKLPKVYEAGSQVEARIYQKSTFFEDLGAHMSQSVETELDVVETWLIVRLKADVPYFQIQKNIFHKNSSRRTPRPQMY